MPRLIAALALALSPLPALAQQTPATPPVIAAPDSVAPPATVTPATRTRCGGARQVMS
ncbi:hypothetical protein [Paracoccus hibiscisoli]|uniref:hypothetical protein n=1 Tax=Paracoccus hibiscisoli TaxID=2023261 RepID=UPI00145D1F07|nr:hypothetical protein [Paracoccus hibiscisoli]